MNPFSRALSAKHAQQGFTLIELMIALVIGLAVVLGAGKLFLVGLQGFREVEALGSKQEAINFAANTLARDIRRASLDNDGNPFINFTSDKLEIRFVNSGDANGCNGSDELVYRVYRLSDEPTGNEGYSLRMGQTCVAYDDTVTNAPQTQPLVAGFAGNGFFYDATESDSENGIWRIGLALYSETQEEVEGVITCDPSEEGEELEIICFHAVNRTKAVL